MLNYVLEGRFFEMDRRPRLRPRFEAARVLGEGLQCARASCRSCRAERPGDPDRATPAGPRLSTSWARRLRPREKVA
jgi:hypothetical protein